ncbi:hypothetical protein GCM10007304_13560 [Rhodococcoides trifolii]|uniref:SWIM-type domain-containing protein n=1 Tax=Rhodococcoides trifolii TaxID=908250 RepID=A0A917FR15_9NOCA|nr:SWIM zinc finger family protein [Rhodococcus trifolii]GGG00912.1 hypothetical protein GCM10007304_13560 [Rhodococcus trifolii]
MVDFSQYGKRRLVAGGIESRTTRGAFGRTWWGKQFVATIEDLADAGRLARGRTYARGKAVLSLEIRRGLIIGDVQGSQNDPFSAVVSVRPLDTFATDELLAEIRQTPGMLAELASGVIPTALGPRLLPTSASELDFECTCPDAGWPCKHAAALTYLAAEEIDVSADKILILRGVELDSLITGIESTTTRVSVDDHFGDEVEFPGLPTAAHAAAPADLDRSYLRLALRTADVEESEIAKAMTDLDGLYRRMM